ncbi:MAG: hypothetical protein RMY31_001335 [Dendronalium sp. ChiSLP03b]
MHRRDASRYNGEPLRSWGFPKWSKWRGNPPSGSPVACGGKPSRSAGLTATRWLINRVSTPNSCTDAINRVSTPKL